MSFVERPNLPQRLIKTAAVGNFPEIAAALYRLGTEVIIIHENAALQEPVNRHADMLCLHLGGSRFLTYDEGLYERLTSLGAECFVPQRGLSPDYPQDIALNCLILDDIVACNTRYCADEVIEHTKYSGRKLLDVRQGYTRCATAVIDERSVITADDGIADRLSGEGVNVLKIRPGFIDLPGYDYGFIGGCCAKVSADKLLVSGDLMKHPDGAAMTEFIHSRGVEIITASDDNLYDFGGVIQIVE